MHDSANDCGKRPKRVKYGDEAARIRNLSRWRRKREQIKLRDLHLCRWCLTQGRLTYDGLEVHHIVPLTVNPDLAFEDGNLITLCGRCHERAEHGEIEARRLRELAGVPPYPAGL